MDYVGVFLNEEGDFLSKMFSSDEEANFALQFLQDFGTNPSNLWPNGEANANANMAMFDENLIYSSENFNTNFFHLSQESSNVSASNCSAGFSTPTPENHHFCDSNIFPVMNDISESMNFCVMDGEINAITQVFPNDNVMLDVLCLNEEMGNDTLGNAENSTDLGLKRQLEVPQQPEKVEDLKTKGESVENPKKKSRIIRDKPKNKRNAEPKKNKKLIQNVNNDEESSYGSQNGQSSSSCSSENDSNASQELIGGETLKSSEKARSGRGASTDPQSLYARKRRERINERLKILQNLVPNGTKVDISTMLEEAVHYVKFLQTQIKLLSSDDMWMYAPIAYNGMDMGLYQKISPTL